MAQFNDSNGDSNGLNAEFAERLFKAESDLVPIEPLTDSHPDLTLSQAYRIQRMNIERRLEAGDKLIGHKVGLTSQAMQEQFGVNEPDYGHLLRSMFRESAVSLDLGELIDPRIEVEPAFILGRPLSGPGVTAQDVLDATDHIRVCFEVIDSRIIDWRIRLPDTVADNGSSARVVLGTKRVSPRALALDDLATDLVIDGEVVESGSTRAILGHPANGVTWLANKFAEFGTRFEAGHIVLPGTCIRAVRVGGHEQVTGRIEGLGEVSITLAGRPAVAHQS